jgi:hypothetical protein
MMPAPLSGTQLAGINSVIVEQSDEDEWEDAEEAFESASGLASRRTSMESVTARLMVTAQRVADAHQGKTPSPPRVPASAADPAAAAKAGAGAAGEPSATWLRPVPVGGRAAAPGGALAAAAAAAAQGDDANSMFVASCLQAARTALFNSAAAAAAAVSDTEQPPPADTAADFSSAVSKPGAASSRFRRPVIPQDGLTAEPGPPSFAPYIVSSSMDALAPVPPPVAVPPIAAGRSSGGKGNNVGGGPVPSVGYTELVNALAASAVQDEMYASEDVGATGSSAWGFQSHTRTRNHTRVPHPDVNRGAAEALGGLQEDEYAEDDWYDDYEEDDEEVEGAGGYLSMDVVMALRAARRPDQRRRTSRASRAVLGG